MLPIFGKMLKLLVKKQIEMYLENNDIIKNRSKFDSTINDQN